MIYEFQNMLFVTKNELLTIVARAWLSAGGMNNCETMLKCLSDMTDEELTTELIESWGLDKVEGWISDQPDSDEKTWMEKRDITPFDISMTFAKLRQSFDEYFPADASKLQ